MQLIQLLLAWLIKHSLNQLTDFTSKYANSLTATAHKTTKKFKVNNVHVTNT